MSEHYGTTILPARAGKPKDKAADENMVGNISRRVIAALRNRQFFSIYEINQAIKEELVKFINRPFQKIPGNRIEAFEKTDKPALRPLPERKYEYADWKEAKVQFNYHVEYDGFSDKKTIQTLSSCTYIEKHLNVILSGKTGTGKTYIACALGNRACRTGHSVKYYRMPELLLEIQDSKAENRYARYMDSIRKVKLLILDDIGLKSYSLEESRDILEITEGRYNRASTVLAGQINCNKWYELFPDPTIADAIMDRVIHNSYILPLDSKSPCAKLWLSRFSVA